MYALKKKKEPVKAGKLIYSNRNIEWPLDSAMEWAEDRAKEMQHRIII